MVKIKKQNEVKKNELDNKVESLYPDLAQLNHNMDHKKHNPRLLTAQA
ncbi:hypothetical protein [Xenorhabdus santafensis]|nr:hypothetical protein [Xenorhabdus sp. 12]